MLNQYVVAGMVTLGAIGLSACDVDKTREGNITMPEYEVKKTQEGDVTVPKFDVDAPEVNVIPKEKVIEVPTIEMEKKTVEVPTIDIEPAKEDDAAKAAASSKKD